MNHTLRGSKCKSTAPSSGIALVTTLLLLIMLSALAMAFVLAVNTENHMQSSDKGATKAFYGAEAGMEKMMADLNGLYLGTASPTVCQIQTLGNGPGGCTTANPYPPISGMSYPEYTLNPTPDSVIPTQPQAYATTVSAGPNQGLIASVIPMSLAVTSHVNPTGEEVRMIRKVEVALIPVFQFGVFSSSDLDFFAGPNMEIGGRVQTNGDLYLAAGGTTTFLGKLRTSKEVVRDSLANGLNVVTSGHTGTIDIPTATGGCNPPPSACRPMSYGTPDEGSWLNNPNWPQPRAFPATPTGGTLNNSWGTISGSSVYNGFIMAEENGVQPLNLPFTKGGTSNIEILRRPQPAEPSLTTESRLYSKAQIRVLLDDDPAHLPGGLNDPNNVRLANVASSGTPAGPDYSQGVPVANVAGGNPANCPSWPPALPPAAGAACNSYFAEGLAFSGAQPNAGSQPVDAHWTAAPNTDDGKAGSPRVPLNGGTGIYPVGAPNMAVNYALPTTPPVTAQRWNLLDGWLRVEYRRPDGTYVPVTHEWLRLGFARDFDPPTTIAGNKVHPNAILILQQLKWSNAITPPGQIPHLPHPAWPTMPPGDLLYPGQDNGLTWMGLAPMHLLDPITGGQLSPQVFPNTGINFYPINMYDTREGETRELSGNYGCSANGVMNITEIDVGNLQQWLLGNIGTSGTSVENQSQNGYILYFSDHRGMIPQPLAPQLGSPAILGAYGFEDLINPASTTGQPNNNLDAGEDVEAPCDSGASTCPPGVPVQRLEVYGSNNLGLGFGFAMSDLAPASIRGTPVTHADEVFTRLPKCDIGRTNWVSGARHGVRLVDGGMGATQTNLPLRASGDPNNVGGFTLASDNPAYILGNYNAGPGQWDSPPAAPYKHASAAVLADTVTLLSNQWNDLNSFATPGRVGGNAPITGPRQSSDTYYRVAIASGKNVDFAHPGYAGGGTPIGTNGGATNPTDADISGTVNGPPSDFGTDGGVHNFLRYLETWGGTTSHYNGSMVSLYYAEYTTGVFKCCGTVYSPPTRQYHFDFDFTNLSEMPPGTPRFQEVVNVGYKQDLTYR